MRLERLAQLSLICGAFLLLSGCISPAQVRDKGKEAASRSIKDMYSKLGSSDDSESKAVLENYKQMATNAAASYSREMQPPAPVVYSPSSVSYSTPRQQQAAEQNAPVTYVKAPVIQSPMTYLEPPQMPEPGIQHPSLVPDTEIPERAPSSGN